MHSIQKNTNANTLTMKNPSVNSLNMEITNVDA